MPTRPAVVAFDVMETLFPLDPAREPIAALGLPGPALELWYARTVRDGAALAATGVFRSFREVAVGVFRGLLAQHDRSPDADLSAVFAALSDLPAHPDVGPAMAILGAAGIRVLALTNGSEANTRTLLKRAGVLDRVERIVSVDEVGAWKPAAGVYRHAVRVAGVGADRVALVAAHAWDCHGAQRTGLTTGWVSRAERHFSPVFGRPDVTGDTLPAVCDVLVRLPEE